MTWESLIEKTANQRSEMDRLARDGIPATPSPERIALYVRYQRGLMGWKRETLAGFARVSLSTLERIERGEQVSKDSLDRVANALRQPTGTFTAPRIPLTSTEAVRKLTEDMAPFEGMIAVPVRPLRGHRRIAALARTHCAIIDAEWLGKAYDDDVAALREGLDLTSEDDASIIQTDTDPVKRRELYNDVLGCVRNLERRGHAVALSGTYKAETRSAALPKMDVALIVFFPKLTDPAAINRRTVFAPAHLNLAAAWHQFRAERA